MKTYLLIFCSALIGFNSYGQTGPGGVGNASNNLVWLDASTITAANGAAIATWSDLSGNNNNFSQVDPLKQPTYKLSDVNLKPSINFNRQSLVASNHLTGLDKTTFFVLKSSSGNNRVLMEFEKFRVYSRISATYPGWSAYFTNTNFIHSNQLISAIPSIIGSVSSSLDLDVDLYTNNTVQNLARGASSSTFTQTTLGGNKTMNITYAGTVSEMAVYEGQLNTAGITIVNNYLSSKYNIAIANDKYAFDGVSGNRERVFGIGRDDASNLNDDAQGNGIVRINNPSSLDDGDYLLIGDNNLALQAISTENPAEVSSRYAREWRVDKTGDAGSVTLTFDVSLNGFGNANSYVLLRDMDGNFADATFSTEVAASGGLVTFVGIDFADGEFFTLGNKDVIETVQDGSWQDPNTWSCTCVPNLNSGPLFIRPSHDVTIDAATSTSSQNLTLDATSSLTFNGDYNLNVFSNLINNGTITTNDQGTIAFVGNLAQTIGGANSIRFNNLTVNNSQGLTLLTDASFIGTLAITTGTFSSGSATMTLLSEAAKTGNIGPIPGLTGTKIFGNFIIQRFVPASNAYWDYLSSPVTSTTLQDWDNELIMSVPGGADGTAFGGTIQYSVRTWDEPTSTSTAVTTIARTLGVAEGFQVFLGDNLTSFAARTFDTRGVPNQATRLKTLKFTDASKGYNVVGNPYPSNVVWSTIQSKSSNLMNEYYIYDKTIKNFAVWNGASSTGTGNLASSGGIIPSSQGFMVRASASPANIIFWESDKTNNTSVWTRPAKQLFAIDFKVHEKNNVYGGQIKLTSNNLASDDIDSLDVGYIENDFDLDSPNIYFDNDNQQMLMNTISTLGEEKHISIFVKANRENTLTINSEIVSNDENYSCIYLEDKTNNKIIDLTSTTSYDFDIADKFERKEFTLHLYKSADVCTNNEVLSIKNVKSELNNVFFINNDENVGVILDSKTPQKATIVVTNVIGQEVIPTQTKEITEPTKVLLNLPQTNSMYIIKVELGNKIYTNKVIR